MHQLARDEDAVTHLCGLDHPHILQSIHMQSLVMQTNQLWNHPTGTWVSHWPCALLLCVSVYASHYTCKSITKQHKVLLPQGCLWVVQGFMGSKIATLTLTHDPWWVTKPLSITTLKDQAIHLDQCMYLQKVIKCCSMLNAKTTSTPLPAGYYVIKNMSPLMQNSTPISRW